MPVTRTVAADPHSYRAACDRNSDDSGVILSAGHVLLRPLRAEDHEPLIWTLTDSDTMKWALEDRPFTLAEAEHFITTRFASGVEPFGMHVISTALDQPAIGFCTFRESDLLAEVDVEFGWVLAKEHHGNGYATALGRALIDYTFNNLQHDRRLPSPQHRLRAHPP
jgi:RimJ/RimL family protein N-acetyltransferase